MGRGSWVVGRGSWVVGRSRGSWVWVKVVGNHRQPKLTFRAVGRYKLVLRNTRPLRIL